MGNKFIDGANLLHTLLTKVAIEDGTVKTASFHTEEGWCQMEVNKRLTTTVTVEGINSKKVVFKAFCDDTEVFPLLLSAFAQMKVDIQGIKEYIVEEILPLPYDALYLKKVLSYDIGAFSNLWWLVRMFNIGISYKSEKFYFKLSKEGKKTVWLERNGRPDRLILCAAEVHSLNDEFEHLVGEQRWNAILKSIWSTLLEQIEERYLPVSGFAAVIKEEMKKLDIPE